MCFVGFVGDVMKMVSCRISPMFVVTDSKHRKGKWSRFNVQFDRKQCYMVMDYAKRLNVTSAFTWLKWAEQRRRHVTAV
jgi:hypothetical protein